MSKFRTRDAKKLTQPKLRKKKRKGQQAGSSNNTCLSADDNYRVRSHPMDLEKSSIAIDRFRHIPCSSGQRRSSKLVMHGFIFAFVSSIHRHLDASGVNKLVECSWSPFVRLDAR